MLFLSRNFCVVFLIDWNFLMIFFVLLIFLIIFLLILELIKKYSSSFECGVIMEFFTSFIEIDLIASASMTFSFLMIFIVFLQNCLVLLLNPIPLPISKTSNLSIDFLMISE